VPGFTAVAVLTLALGIGANTAIFTALDQALIRTLPVEDPGRLVAFVTDPAGTPGVFSYPLYATLRDHNDVLAGLAAFLQRPFTMSTGVQSERIIGEVVSGNYFSVVGVRPALGRFFLADEDRTPGTHAVAVIGHGLWRRRFDADPGIAGRSVVLNGHAYTIVGVAPPEFRGVTRGTISEVYVPTMMQAQTMPGSRSMLENPNAGWLRMIGRLKPGVGRVQAQSALAILADPGATDSPSPKASDRQKNSLLLMDGGRGHTNRVQDLSLPLTLLTAIVAFVLLIACANVANLLLARASTRAREIAVRLAVGASRARIVRQLLTESLGLALLGGAAGLLIARWASGALLGFQQQTQFVPRMLDGTLDGRALAFTLGLSLVTAIAFSLAPALVASRPNLVDALKRDVPGAAGGSRRLGLRSLLVVAQVALSIVVLIGAALCLKSVAALQAIDPGLEPARVATASFDLSLSGYDQERGRRFVSDLTGRAATLPGVESVSVANIVAFSELFWISGAQIDGYVPGPGDRLAFDFNAVGADYFRTIGASLVEGREFTAQDALDAPRVIVVNEATARRYWPGQSAVGKRTSRGEVVGVVRDTREKGLTETPRPAIYLPLLQSYTPQLTLHVRSAADPRSLLPGIRSAVHALDPTLPVYSVRTLADEKDGSLYAERLAAALLSGFAALALIVAAGGIYAVLSYAVSERTREIGIRLAQGAQPRDLLRLVVGQGMLLTLIGVVIGLAASFALTRLIAGLLFGVSATDPLTFTGVPLLLSAVALLACWFPARRATRLSPLAALRHE
jgi:putative ABC transport system permease protein